MMHTNTFNYKREEAQNPYTGFTSFQHFRGEKLYEDIVSGNYYKLGKIAIK